VEASALTPPVGISRARRSLGTPLWRLRSDEQLVALFRDGHDDAFRVIYDRYRQRLFAYTRQMLPGSRQDAEDALQDVFVRAYSGLRANDRELALRAWLYRVAHNRCVDEIRRPAPPAPEVLERLQLPTQDLMAAAEERESLRQLVADLRRLPDQQRSALLMRELEGMKYTDMAEALAVSVPAVKSLLVRARVSLAQAAEARDTACSEIRAELICAHDRGVRPSGMARRHMHDCAGCRDFRGEMRTVSKQLAAFIPALGPFGLIAKLLGIGGGAGGGAAAGSSAAAAGGVAAGSGGAVASAGALAGGASHVATLLAAAVVTAGSAVVIQHSATPAPARHAHHRAAPIAASEASSPAPSGVAVTYIAPPRPDPAPAAPSAASSTASASTAAASSSSSSTSSSRSATPPRPDPSRLPGSPARGPTRLGSDLAGSPGTGPTTPAGAATRAGTGTPAASATPSHSATGTGSTTGSSTATPGTTGTSTTSTTTSGTPTGTTATIASASPPTGTSTTPSNPPR
jgi:RNA polymerase sigma factor (sigma-70 family)